MRDKTNFILLLALLMTLPARVCAQSAAQHKADTGQLGMTCAQILQMSSSDWIAKVVSQDASTVDGKLRGIASYGHCYDARTDRLAASLAKTGKGPLMGAKADFRDFDAAITAFTAKALAPTPDPVKAAYAALYQKQFRYAFYQDFEPKPPGAPDATKKPVSHPPAEPTPAAPPTPKPSGPTVPNAKPGAEPKPVDEMTLAKNAFGELLRAMEDDRLHEIHGAFGQILGEHKVSPATQLAVYRHAIFVLEPPTATPFSPPPF